MAATSALHHQRFFGLAPALHASKLKAVPKLTRATRLGFNGISNGIQASDLSFPVLLKLLTFLFLAATQN